MDNGENEVVSIFMEDLRRWDPVLVGLVRKNQIDPWTVDIESIIKAYLTELDIRDFRSHGQTILTLATLLKLKSQTVSLDVLREEVFSYEDDFWDDFSVDFYEEGGEVIPKDFIAPKIAPRPRRFVKRKVSLMDLVDAFEKVMDTKKRKNYKALTIKRNIKVNAEFDMQKIIDNIQDKLDSLWKEKDKVLFSELHMFSLDELIWSLISILYLTSEEKAEISQNKWYDDIIIEQCGENENGIEA